jgi:hypothetical protein
MPPLSVPAARAMNADAPSVRRERSLSDEKKCQNERRERSAKLLPKREQMPCDERTRPLVAERINPSSSVLV